MTWYRLQEKDSELRYIDNDTMLVTDRPKVIWNLWFGQETCDLYQVEGTIVEDRTETHEDENGNKITIRAPMIKVKSIKKIESLEYKNKEVSKNENNV